MHRTRFIVVVCFLFLAFSAQAQVTKSGSIFTDAANPRVQSPGTEEIKTDPPNATVIREITYCKVGARELRMDAYLPKNRGTALSAPLIYIHGGAWISGDKDEGPIEQDLSELLTRGYAVFSINYRLAPLNPFPAAIEDCKCAVRSLRANAAKYQIDAKRIGVWGSSAGGHLAAFLGTTAGIGQLEGYGGYPEQSSTVQAVGTYFGPADLTTSDWGFIDKLGFLLVFGTSKNWARASPINYITKNDAPFYVVGGDRDDRVDVRQPQAMFARLQAAGVPSELLIVKNCDHEFEPKGGALSPSRGEVTKRLADFFDKTIRTATLQSAEPDLRSVTTRKAATTR
jgi:acetyl esterase/lipase